MKQKWEDYKTFRNLEDAKDLTDVLAKAEIPYFLEKVAPIFDPAFGGNNENDAVLLRLLPDDFERANEVYEASMDIDVDNIDKDYYLFGFTDHELKDVVIKKEEWNAFDYVLAQNVLRRRGKEIGPEELDEIRRQRRIELSQYKPYPKIKIILGYFFALAGGLIGLFIGLELIWNTKKLDNGTTMFVYDQNARSHGRILVVLGLIMIGAIFIFSRALEYKYLMMWQEN